MLPHDSGMKFTPALGQAICLQISEGWSLRRIARGDDQPEASTVYGWLLEAEAAKAKPEDERTKDEAAKVTFLEQYARARSIQADILAEETVDIADDGHNDTYLDDDGNRRTDYDVIQRSKLRVDARKWYAGKVAPKKYGESLVTENVNRNLNVNTPGAGVSDLTDDQLKRIQEIVRAG